MFSVEACPLPDDALLQTYRANGSYADCFRVDVAGAVSHEQYVIAFYTSPVFWLERVILARVVAKPTTDAQVSQLAHGEIEAFAAWRVEKRCRDQLLLADYRGRTRSWLMVVPLETANGPATRLYFGSAVVPARAGGSTKARLGFVFRALLGFHTVYSMILLGAARRNLRRP